MSGIYVQNCSASCIIPDKSLSFYPSIPPPLSLTHTQSLEAGIICIKPQGLCLYREKLDFNAEREWDPS